MADYAISNVARRVVYAPSGVGPYAFTFEILTSSDIAVYRGSTLLTLTTDYTVTINANGTGSVTLVATAGTSNITIVGAKTIQRTTDFTTGGDFFANTINDELDAQTIFIQQVAETAERGLKAPVIDPTDINMTLPSKASRAGKTLAFDANGNPAVGEDIGNWRGNWAAGTSYTVRDLVRDASNQNVYRCNTAHTSTGTTPISSNADVAKWDIVIAVSDLNSLVDDAEAAQTAAEAAQAAAEAAQAAAETAETNAETAETNAETAATNASNSATAAASSASSASSSASSASSSASTATTQASNASTSATNAASSASAASTSATNAASSATSASGSASTATTQATNASNSASSASTSASNASTSASNASTSATNASNSASAASTSASNAATSETNAAASAAAAATALDNFDDRYLGSKSSAPTLDNDGNALVSGALYFNDGTVTAGDKGMWVYDGAAWIKASAAAQAALVTYEYIATAGQTTFSGSDANAATLAYTAGGLIVSLNGVVLKPGDDYTATNGTSIVLIVAAALNDELCAYAFSSFSVANAVARTGDTMTGALLLPDGSAAAPSLSNDGDTNTGIFFPAADTIAFSEGGAESMRLDSSGNLGIGTTSPGAKLEVKGASATAGQLSIHDGTGDTTVSGVTAASLLFQARDSSVRTIAEIDAVNTTTNGTGGAMVFQTRISDTLAERMRIDSSGNVGIGTSSPAQKFTLQASGNTWLLIEDTLANGYNAATLYKNTDRQFRVGTLGGVGGFTNGAFIIYDETAAAWRMVINSTGEVIVGGVTDNGAYNLQCNGTGVWGAGAYVNGSDRRIKEDIAPLTSGLDVVIKLNPVTYRYKEDWSKDQSIQPGFIAQEMLVAMEGQDYVDGVVSQGGAAGYYSVAYQNIIPLLTKAIQEQQQMIETLQAKVAALEGAA